MDVVIPHVGVQCIQPGVFGCRENIEYRRANDADFQPFDLGWTVVTVALKRGVQMGGDIASDITVQ
jgi:hypothetical protein